LNLSKKANSQNLLADANTLTTTNMDINTFNPKLKTD
jgi:hypothetical protein